MAWEAGFFESGDAHFGVTVEWLAGLAAESAPQQKLGVEGDGGVLV